eukprot:401097_1
MAETDTEMKTQNVMFGAAIPTNITDIMNNKSKNTSNTPLLDDNTDAIDGIKEFLDGGDELDIYQLVAFRVKTGGGCCAKTETGKKYVGYWIDIIKAAICIFAQFASIIVLYEYTFDTIKEESGKGWCDGEGKFNSRLMAIAYTLFLSSIFITTYIGNQNAGFYLHLEYESFDYNFISSEWLYFGRIVNGLLILNSFYLSFLITFFTEDPFDIILNAVALLFIADIDNMVVDSFDYKKTLKWFEKQGNVKSISKQEMHKCKSYFWHSMQYIEMTLGVISLLFIFVVPFFVAVCY